MNINKITQLLLLLPLALIAKNFIVTNNTPFTIDFTYEWVTLFGDNRHTLANIASRDTQGSDEGLVNLKKRYTVVKHSTLPWKTESGWINVDNPEVVIDKEFSFGKYPAYQRHVTVNYDPASQKFSFKDKRQ